MAERIPLHLLSDMLGLYDKRRREGTLTKTAIYQEIAVMSGRSPDVVRLALTRLRPTARLAEAVLQRGAVRLAARVVRKANVAEAIDILSRPNIGVLEPAKSQDKQGGGGFFLSVQAGDLGAVKVGVQLGNIQPAVKELPPSQEFIDIEGEGEDHASQEAVPASPARATRDSSGSEPVRKGKRGGSTTAGSRIGPGRSKHVQAAIEEARIRIEAARVKQAKEREYRQRLKERGNAESYQEHRRVQVADEQPESEKVT